MTTFEEALVVNLPRSTVYNQWTQFEDFPRFMKGITSVWQLDETRLEWVATIGGVRRSWEAEIIEQIPDRKISWVAIDCAPNSGVVIFTEVEADRTEVRLVLEYEPQDWVEKLGDTLHAVENRAHGDLGRFKDFIENRGQESGAWRGAVAHQEPSPGPTTGARSGTATDPISVQAPAPSVSPVPNLLADDSHAFPEDHRAGPDESDHIHEDNPEESQEAQMTTAREIMTPGTECIGENQTLEDAARKMKDLNVGALPICGEDDRLKGMVTDRDIVRGCVAAGSDPRQVRAGELGDGKPVTIGADDTIEEAITTMSTHRVRRLPVIDGYQLVGMLSQADVARSMPEDRAGELVELISYD